MGNTPVFVIDNTQAQHIIGKKYVFDLTASAGVSGGSTVYTGIITGGGSSAFAGVNFNVWGFLNTPNNGPFPCTASSATTLTLTNTAGVAESASARCEGWQGVAENTVGNTWAVPSDPITGRMSNFTWETTYAGSPTGVSVTIQGSNDGVFWQTIDTTTSTSGEARYVANNPFKFLRANVGTLSGGSSPTALVIVQFGR